MFGDVRQPLELPFIVIGPVLQLTQHRVSCINLNGISFALTSSTHTLYFDAPSITQSRAKTATEQPSVTATALTPSLTPPGRSLAMRPGMHGAQSWRTQPLAKLGVLIQSLEDQADQAGQGHRGAVQLKLSSISHWHNPNSPTLVLVLYGGHSLFYRHLAVLRPP